MGFHGNTPKETETRSIACNTATRHCGINTGTDGHVRRHTEPAGLACAAFINVAADNLEVTNQRT